MPQWPSYIYMYRFLKFSIGTHDLLHQVLVTSINHSQIHILRKKQTELMTVLLLANFVVA